MLKSLLFHPTAQGVMMKNRIYLIAIVLALTTFVAACAPSQPLPGDVLFQDDFSDISSGWYRVSTTEGITNYQTGIYRILVNEAQTDVWSNPGLNFTDAIIEVEATKAAGPNDNFFGVMCRYTETEEDWGFYYFLLSSDGYYGISKYSNGEYVVLGGESFPYDEDVIQHGEATNTIEAKCVESTLTLSINGTQMMEVEDSTYAAGDIGLVGTTLEEPGTDIHFDNLVVKQP